jgi:hypothetical protein
LDRAAGDRCPADRGRFVLEIPTLHRRHRHGCHGTDAR